MEVYYLPRWRSVLTGVLLLVIGTSLFILTSGILFDSNVTLSKAVENSLISFRGVFEFIASITFLAIKIFFIYSGIRFLVMSKKISIISLENNKIRYQRTPKSKYDVIMLSFYGDLSEVIYYSNIEAVELVGSKLKGYQVSVKLKTENRMFLLGVSFLSKENKQEIVSFINEKISNHR